MMHIIHFIISLLNETLKKNTTVTAASARISFLYTRCIINTVITSSNYIAAPLYVVFSSLHASVHCMSHLAFFSLHAQLWHYMNVHVLYIRLLYISQCIKAQTPPIRFLVDLLYNKLYDKSTTNQIPRWSLAHDLLWTCCTVRANHGREFTWRHITSCLILFAAVEFNDGERKRYCTRRSTRNDASISLLTLGVFF